MAIREDYPYIDNREWLKWTEIRKEREAMKVSARDIPIKDYPYQPEKREKSLHPRWATAEKLGIIKIEQETVRWA
jgi:hypothetical protein